MKIEQLAGDLFRDYRINKHRSLTDVQARWRLHLKPFFGSVIAAQLDSRQLEQYVDTRLEEHASNHVFTRGDKPVRDFRKSWENLCAPPVFQRKSS